MTKRIIEPGQPITITQFMEQLIAIELCYKDDDGTLQTRLEEYYAWVKTLEPTDNVVWTANEEGRLGPVKCERK